MFSTPAKTREFLHATLSRMPNLFPCALLLFSSLTTPVLLRAQDTCKTVAEAERKTYGFRPSKLSDAERKLKSVAMDSYWNLVKRAGPAGADCLRQLLQKQTDGFAVFDEASLLYSLSNSPESRDTVVEAIAKTDLADVQPADYVRLGLRLAHDGADIEPVSRNYLTATNDVTTYLAAHGGFKLDRPAGALLLYGIMPTEKIDDALSKAVNSGSAESRNAAAIVWSLHMTERSFKGLASLGDMKEFSSETRRQVRSVLIPYEVPVTPAKYTREQMLAKISKFPDFDMDPTEDFERENKALDNSVYATLTEADVATLRESRRKFITGVSNEAVESYSEMSRVLLHLINKLHLYEEFRKVGQ
jgi:hypothetical protein